jgi:hypothetical protein
MGYIAVIPLEDCSIVFLPVDFTAVILLVGVIAVIRQRAVQR